MKTISSDEVRRMLHYSPETGEFTWKNPRQSRHAGKIAGSKNMFGYWMITICGDVYSAHRLVFLYMAGCLPDRKTNQVDHINGVRDDNRYSNLRIVTRSINLQNKRMYKNNKMGIVGVYWNKRIGKWESSIRVDGKLKTFKRTDDFFEACVLRRSAEIRFGYHHNHGKSFEKGD